MEDGVRYWAVIPAAGAGKRMQSDTPKQYLHINGKPVIEYSLDVFINHSRIESTIVAISECDTYWTDLPVAKHPKVRVTGGGPERCHSVMNCLACLKDLADENDWVFVHDAARPCLRGDEIDKMITELSGTDGGLLALPVRDTMKRAIADNVKETVDREGLWHALTPQMFRLSDLSRALQMAIDKGERVTDESQAMEMAGFRPRLIEGRLENIKITHTADLTLASLYLS